MIKQIVMMASMLALSACPAPYRIRPLTPSDTFFEHISTYCGKAFAGKLVAFDESDSKRFQAPLVMHISTCSYNEIRIPFHAGNDHSRTWVIRRGDRGIFLKHDHRHKDGSQDALSDYGGEALYAGSENRQEFAVDAASKEMFKRDGLTASLENVWAMEISPEKTFVYELRRPNRHFRIEFDLQNPVAEPPAAWGSAQ